MTENLCHVGDEQITLSVITLSLISYQDVPANRSLLDSRNKAQGL